MTAAFVIHPNLNEVGVSRNYIDDTLNSDLVKIKEWGRVNRVEFNARKTQCCYRTSEHPILAKAFIWMVWPLQNRRLLMFLAHGYDLTFVGMILFSMCRKKQCKKYFTPSDLRTIYVTYIIPIMEYNSHLWAGASKSALDFVDRIYIKLSVEAYRR